MNPNFNKKLNKNPSTPLPTSERRNSEWDIKNAPKNYISLIITQGGSSLLAFAAVWLITKTLGSEGYGGIVAIIAASQIAQVLVNWTSYALIKFGAEEFVEMEHISRIFWLRIIIFLPNLVLVLLTSNLWFPFLANWLKLSSEAFYLVILHFVFSLLWIHIQFSLQGVKLQRLQGGLLTFERLIIFGGLAILWLTGKLNVISATLFYAVTPLLMSLTGFWFLRNYIFKRFSVNRTYWRDIFMYSAPLLPYSLVAYFSTGYIDAVFISKFLSTKDLGIYSVATQINGMFLQIPTLANSLLIPFFVTLHKENRNSLLQSYFHHAFPSMIIAGGMMCSLVAFISYFLLPLVFGSVFFEAVLPLWILLAASVIALPGMLGYAALTNSTSATYIATLVALVSGVTNISINFLLIPTYGMKGCAWATAISFFISSLTFATLLVLKKNLSYSWTFMAILPSLFGAAVYTYTENPWLSLLVCFIFTIVIMYFKRSSLNQSINILKKILNR